MSPAHAWAAAYFARRAGEIETDAARFDEHRACVMAAVLESGACLEATINELFADAADHRDRLAGLALAAREVLTDAWARPEVRRGPTVDKYAVAFQAIRGEPLNSGQGACQTAELVLSLRNKLVHYAPEWAPSACEGGRRPPDEPMGALRGKFPLHARYRDTGNPFWPLKCLGSGCARWAVVSAVAFVDEFSARAIDNACTRLHDGDGLSRNHVVGLRCQRDMQADIIAL